ncbi:hypothetical protein FE374_17315 [Georgenia yuyongxinii]|uniref:Uncharacterized protein n=1 Tax=Georgenia yuyongxinii TaxID=2589797 RepID=A0A5B8C9M0_9MICO|nr:hypothetical protein [Georgenia yuyongxinii]QDC26135.1 hypothetical protein FE374_17315 [Georgenia yuyongxinii]
MTRKHDPDAEEPRAAPPGRGRYDEGQASDEDLQAELGRHHGRYDDGERTDTTHPSTDELLRGRYDEGQATDADLAAGVRRPHGRYDEGTRAPDADSDDAGDESRSDF